MKKKTNLKEEQEEEEEEDEEVEMEQSLDPPGDIDEEDNELELEHTDNYIEPPNYKRIDYRISQPTYYSEPHLIDRDELTPGITRREYEQRRARLFRKIPKVSMVLLPSNPECRFSADGKYKYRQDASFSYFTGLAEANSLALLTKDAAGRCKYILFVQCIVESDRTWHGYRCGLQAAVKYFGANEAYDFDRAREKLADLLMEFGIVYMDQNVNEALSKLIGDIQRDKKLSKFSKSSGSSSFSNFSLRKSGKLIQEIRLIKSEAEISLLRRSAEISSLSMIDAMQFCKPGLLENELSVQFEYGCKVRGAQRLSFECAVASGKNATNLIYFNNNSLLHDGDLCLIDCGAEYNGYASDITRTFPVNGKFNAAQRELYEMVLAVSDKLISKMVPGCTIKKLETDSAKLLKAGLKRLGVTSNLQPFQVKELKIASSDVHFVTHFIGLDIHDTSEVSQSKPFAANMVLAIEPAIYIPDHPMIPPKYRNLGIRIEDDVLITNGKPEILSKALPRSVPQIEQFMSEQAKNHRIVPFSLLRNQCDAAGGDEDEDDDDDDNKQSEDTSLITAARILSSLRFATTQKEEIEQQAIGRQRDWLRMLQQVVYDELDSSHGHSNKATKSVTSRSSRARCTRSGLRYNDNADYAETKSICVSKSQKEEEKRKRGKPRKPKLSTPTDTKTIANATAKATTTATAAAANSPPAGSQSNHSKSGSLSVSTSPATPSKCESKRECKPQPQSEPCSVRSAAISSHTNAVKHAQSKQKLESTTGSPESAHHEPASIKIPKKRKLRSILRGSTQSDIKPECKRKPKATCKPKPSGESQLDSVSKPASTPKLKPRPTAKSQTTTAIKIKSKADTQSTSSPAIVDREYSKSKQWRSPEIAHGKEKSHKIMHDNLTDVDMVHADCNHSHEDDSSFMSTSTNLSKLSTTSSSTTQSVHIQMKENDILPANRVSRKRKREELSDRSERSRDRERAQSRDNHERRRVENNGENGKYRTNDCQKERHRETPRKDADRDRKQSVDQPPAKKSRPNYRLYSNKEKYQYNYHHHAPPHPHQQHHNDREYPYGYNHHTNTTNGYYGDHTLYGYNSRPYYSEYSYPPQYIPYYASLSTDRWSVYPMSSGCATNSSSSPNSESAYESFMAKSNDKNNNG